MKKAVFLALLVCVLIPPAFAAAGEKEYRVIVDTVENPALLKNVPFSMRIIAFSIASDGLKILAEKDKKRRPEISRVIKKMAALALGPYVSPFSNTTVDTVLSDYCLYLSHLNIILSNYHLITDKNNYFSLQTKINSYLLKRTRQEKNVHVPSFPGQKLRFPADQSVVIYSLALYDKTYNLTLSTAVRDAFFSFLEEKGLNRHFGLPVSELSGRVWYASYPRGCASSYIVYYLSRVNPSLARKYWQNYLRHYKGTIGNYALLREWAAHKSNKSYMTGLARWKKKYGMAGDIDSGPVVAGYGASATGLGVLGAKGAGDIKTYNQLVKTIGSGIKLFSKVNKKFSASLDNFLTNAILFTASVM